MAKSSNKSMKKRLIIAFVIILGALLVLSLITALIPYIGELFAVEDEEIIAEFNFYPADYKEDIYADEEYLALIKNGILKYNDGMGSIISVDIEDYKDSTNAEATLIKMVYSIVDGNNDKYNSYFSEEYYKKNQFKEKFTKQKIHDGTLTFFAAETVEDKNGSYNEYTFKLKYRIYENNGTFRKDIGDWPRTQYIVITDRDGKWLIDSIMYEKVK